MKIVEIAAGTFPVLKVDLLPRVTGPWRLCLLCVQQENKIRKIRYACRFTGGGRIVGLLSLQFQ